MNSPPISHKKRKGVVPQQQRSVQFSSPSKRSVSSGAESKSHFRQCQEAQRAHEYTTLNKACQKEVGDSNDKDYDPTRLELLQGAYCMSAREIDARFGSAEEGYLVMFGSNESNQMGKFVVGALDDPIPLLMEGSKKYQKVACGGLHNVALDYDGVPYTWGSGDEKCLARDVRGEDGDDSDDDGAASNNKDAFPENEIGPVEKFTTRDGKKEEGTITQVSAGNCHTLFLSKSGNVFFAGAMKEDSIFFRIPPDEHSKTDGVDIYPQHIWNMPGKAIFVDSGGDFGAAILQDRTMVTWGIAQVGELGRTEGISEPEMVDGAGGKKVSRGRVVKRTSFVDGRDPIHEFVRENFLKPRPPIFNYGSPRKTVLTMSCGSSHMLVVAREPGQADTNVYSCGSNVHGELGHGDKENSHELKLIKALEGENIAQVACGEHISAALGLTGKRMFTWGKSVEGRLGRGAPEKITTSAGTLAEKPDLTPTLLPFPTEKPLTITKIAVGDHRMFALTEKEELYSWGTAETTGNNLIVEVNRPMKIDFPKYLGKKSVRVLDISSGGQHSAALVAFDKE